MSNNIQSDAQPFPTNNGKQKELSEKKPDNTRVQSGTVSGGPAQQNTNKAIPFPQPGQGSVINIHLGNMGGQRRPQGVTKHVKSTFNISKSHIMTASMGNQGPVTHTNEHIRYKAGAKKQDIKIRDGTFNQANIGGKADYVNEGSVVASGTGTGAGAAMKAGFVDISKCDPPFSPEEYLAKLLQTGVSAEDLIQLLEKKYSIVNLAYTLPSSACKRAFMVDTLLKMADMEEMET